jgi:hypothetical protein
VVSARSIDHVILAVTDLEGAAERFLQDHGLASVEGGRHLGWGTANRIVPLGESYLELVAVVDGDEAALSRFGSWVGDNASDPPTAHAICLRTHDLDEVCARLGLEPVAMTREAPHDVTLRWRLAGLEKAFDEGLPFFVEWDIPADAHPGRMEPGNRARIDEVVLTGDVDRLRAWTSGARGVRVGAGEPGIDWVGFAAG